MAMKYEVIIYWSEQDQRFIAEVPELAGCMADGPTKAKAIAAVDVVAREWIETAQSMGRQIPVPREVDAREGCGFADTTNQTSL